MEEKCIVKSAVILRCLLSRFAACSGGLATHVYDESRRPCWSSTAGRFFSLEVSLSFAPLGIRNNFNMYPSRVVTL